MRARGKGVVAQAVTRNPVSVKRFLDDIGLGRQAHQHGDLVKGEGVAFAGAACVHGKKTGARNLCLDFGGDEIRLGPLIGKNLAKDCAPRR